MSNSLRDQLLKAGLATQAQVDKAEQDKRQPPKKQPERSERPPAPKQHARPPRPDTPKPQKPAPQTTEDLAQFYTAREKLERAEKAEQERLQREASERKKRVRAQVKALLEGKLLNNAEAEIRYNFVVGETVKYLYVTTEQQAQLAAGQLAITFIDGKRCLITLETAQQIKELDPDKLVVIADPTDELDSPDTLPPEVLGLSQS